MESQWTKRNELVVYNERGGICYMVLSIILFVICVTLGIIDAATKDKKGYIKPRKTSWGLLGLLVLPFVLLDDLFNGSNKRK